MVQCLKNIRGAVHLTVDPMLRFVPIKKYRGELGVDKHWVKRSGKGGESGLWHRFISRDSLASRRGRAVDAVVATGDLDCATP
jgi:hypothetical protein